MFLWNSVNFCSPHVRIQDSWKVKTGVCRVLHGALFSTWSTELFCSCVPNMKRCLAPPWKKDRSWSNAQCLPFVWLRKTSPNSLLSCWKKCHVFVSSRILHWEESNTIKLISVFLSSLWLCPNFNLQTIYVELFGNGKLWVLFLIL